MYGDTASQELQRLRERRTWLEQIVSAGGPSTYSLQLLKAKHQQQESSAAQRNTAIKKQLAELCLGSNAQHGSAGALLHTTQFKVARQAYLAAAAQGQVWALRQHLEHVQVAQQLAQEATAHEELEHVLHQTQQVQLQQQHAEQLQQLRQQLQDAVKAAAASAPANPITSFVIGPQPTCITITPQGLELQHTGSTAQAVGAAVAAVPVASCHQPPVAACGPAAPTQAPATISAVNMQVPSMPMPPASLPAGWQQLQLPDGRTAWLPPASVHHSSSVPLPSSAADAAISSAARPAAPTPDTTKQQLQPLPQDGQPCTQQVETINTAAGPADGSSVKRPLDGTMLAQSTAMPQTTATPSQQGDLGGSSSSMASSAHAAAHAAGHASHRHSSAGSESTMSNMSTTTLDSPASATVAADGVAGAVDTHNIVDCRLHHPSKANAAAGESAAQGSPMPDSAVLGPGWLALRYAGSMPPPRDMEDDAISIGSTIRRIREHAGASSAHTSPPSGGSGKLARGGSPLRMQASLDAPPGWTGGEAGPGSPTVSTGSPASSLASREDSPAAVSSEPSSIWGAVAEPVGHADSRVSHAQLQACGRAVADDSAQSHSGQVVPLVPCVVIDQDSSMARASSSAQGQQSTPDSLESTVDATDEERDTVNSPTHAVQLTAEVLASSGHVWLAGGKEPSSSVVNQRYLTKADSLNQTGDSEGIGQQLRDLAKDGHLDGLLADSGSGVGANGVLPDGQSGTVQQGTVVSVSSLRASSTPASSVVHQTCATVEQDGSMLWHKQRQGSGSLMSHQPLPQPGGVGAGVTLQGPALSFHQRQHSGGNDHALASAFMPAAGMLSTQPSQQASAKAGHAGVTPTNVQTYVRAQEVVDSNKDATGLDVSAAVGHVLKDGSSGMSDSGQSLAGGLQVDVGTQASSSHADADADHQLLTAAHHTASHHARSSSQQMPTHGRGQGNAADSTLSMALPVFGTTSGSWQASAAAASKGTTVIAGASMARRTSGSGRLAASQGHASSGAAGSHAQEQPMRHAVSMPHSGHSNQQFSHSGHLSTKTASSLNSQLQQPRLGVRDIMNKVLSKHSEFDSLSSSDDESGLFAVQPVTMSSRVSMASNPLQQRVRAAADPALGKVVSHGSTPAGGSMVDKGHVDSNVASPCSSPSGFISGLFSKAKAWGSHSGSKAAPHAAAGVAGTTPLVLSTQPYTVQPSARSAHAAANLHEAREAPAFDTDF